MEAAVFSEPGRCELVEREPPAPLEGEVLVKVEACGVCGTDLHIYRGEFPARFPVVAGHEFAGVVEEVGAGVVGLRSGEHVAIDPNISCGACRPCQRGRLHLCRNLSAIGVTSDGGFGTHCVVPAQQAYTIPDHMAFAVAAMSEPLACCVHGIERAQIRPGEVVVIIGAGMIGLMMVQLALIQGASVVIVSELDAHKREVARSLGASRVVNPENAELREYVAEATEGSGGDVAIECVGSAGTAQQAVSLVGEGGRVVLFGVAPESTRIGVAPYEVYRREITITGSFTNPFTQARALALLEKGRVKVEGLISHRLPLAEVPAALELMEAGQATKIVIEPQRRSM